jgi:hypothetical protein
MQITLTMSDEAFRLLKEAVASIKTKGEFRLGLSAPPELQHDWCKIYDAIQPIQSPREDAVQKLYVPGYFKHEGPVLQPWVQQLCFMQQSVLLTGIRGCDGVLKEDASKFVTRQIRRAVLQSARPNWAGRTFLGEQDKLTPDDARTEFIRNHDHLPNHYLVHTMHAAEIIGYKHPDPQTAATWLKFYVDLVVSLHLKTETEAEMDARLSDKP